MKLTTSRTSAKSVCCPPSNQEVDLRPIEGEQADEELATLAKALVRASGDGTAALNDELGRSAQRRRELEDAIVESEGELAALASARASADAIVDGLRQIDQRFGYNAKPTRAWVPSIIAGDEIAYHFGSDPSEGSPNAFAVDVLAGHCTGVGVIPGNTSNRHAHVYRPFYEEYVRWTGAGRF